jgi:site-specific DNA recombinase
MEAPKSAAAYHEGRAPHDQVFLQIRGAVAEYERVLIAERMRRGRQMKLQAACYNPPLERKE